jgi:hypothetical protein
MADRLGNAFSGGIGVIPVVEGRETLEESLDGMLGETSETVISLFSKGSGKFVIGKQAWITGIEPAQDIL